MEGPKTSNKLYVGSLCICIFLIASSYGEQFPTSAEDSQRDDDLLSKEQQLKEYLQILKVRTLFFCLKTDY